MADFLLLGAGPFCSGFIVRGLLASARRRRCLAYLRPSMFGGPVLIKAPRRAQAVRREVCHEL